MLDQCYAYFDAYMLNILYVPSTLCEMTVLNAFEVIKFYVPMIFINLCGIYEKNDSL